MKLADEGNILHLRVYLENPPAGQEDRALSTVPAALRTRIAALPSNQAGGVLEVGNRTTPRASELVAKIQSALTRDPNVLLVGPPGTGKTVALEDLRALYQAQIFFDPDLWEDAWNEGLQGTGRKVVSLVFHPSYTYENFVAGLVPASGGSGFSLQTQAGPLLSMAHWASSPGREGLIIIDEFNRAPAAAVFGDTIALLDTEKRVGNGNPGARIARPYPRQPMEVAQEFAQPGNVIIVPEQIALPRSLGIVAAMNSTDRSVAPLDAALRRRFAIINVPPDYEALARHWGASVPDLATAHTPTNPYSLDELKELALRLLLTINRRIEQLLGSDFLLGQALLWQVSGTDAGEFAVSLVRAFEERVLATLKLTFVDQDEALSAVLNVPMPPNLSPLGTWQQPSASMAGVASQRLVLNQLLSQGDWMDQITALSTILE
ncbi:MAG TPA: AAA family ATPase [Sphingomicrobium sp.]|nr:AAA family ATPase [Sphingomicrobium sp.]